MVTSIMPGGGEKERSGTLASQLFLAERAISRFDLMIISIRPNESQSHQRQFDPYSGLFMSTGKELRSR